MTVHLIDGTYELFRHYYALPSALDAQGREVGAVRGGTRVVQLNRRTRVTLDEAGVVAKFATMDPAAT